MTKTKKEKVEKRDKKYPGYPSEPESKDITEKGEKVPGTYENVEDKEHPDSPRPRPMGTTDDADLTQQDINELEATRQQREPESNISLNQDHSNEPQTGEDMDVPGSELDDDMEDIGSEDEENNYYSIGGERHEDLELPDESVDEDEDTR